LGKKNHKNQAFTAVIAHGRDEFPLSVSFPGKETTEHLNMKKEDLQEIGSLVARVLDQRSGQFQQEIKSDMAGLRGELKSDMAEMRAEFDLKLAEHGQSIKQDFRAELRHQFGVYSEDLKHQVQLLAEGHLPLAEKIGRIDHRLKKTEVRLDLVVSELLAHRADTEAHKIYQVKEGGNGL